MTSAGVAATLALVIATGDMAAASPEKLPVGHYVGRTAQNLPVAFDFVTKKGIVPQLDPSGPALYDFVAMTKFRCNHGGGVQRRVLIPVALTDAAGAFGEGPGSGTTPIRGELQTFSFHGRIRSNGQASGSFEQTITNIENTKGRVCMSGTVNWTAKLRP
jgi:hypothetical protein